MQILRNVCETSRQISLEPADCSLQTANAIMFIYMRHVLGWVRMLVSSRWEIIELRFSVPVTELSWLSKVQARSFASSAIISRVVACNRVLCMPTRSYLTLPRSEKSVAQKYIVFK